MDGVEELRRLWMRSQPREIRRADVEVGPWVLVIDEDLGGPRWGRYISVDGAECHYGAGIAGRNPFGYDRRAVRWRIALRGRNVAHYILDVSGDLGRLGDVQDAKDAADQAWAAWVAETETVTISGDPKAFDGFPVYRLGELFDEIDRLRRGGT